MSKKIASRKLQLNKETLRTLSGQQLEQVAGGTFVVYLQSKYCVNTAVIGSGGGASAIVLTGCLGGFPSGGGDGPSGNG
jgi:hypothetical protein